jgi:hypothetical protein
MLITGIIVLNDNTHPQVLCTVQDTQHSTCWKVLHHPHTDQACHCVTSCVWPSLESAEGQRFRFKRNIKAKGVHHPSSNLGASLWRGFIGWCNTGTPVPMLMGAIFNCLYSSEQNNPQMDIIRICVILSITDLLQNAVSIAGFCVLGQLLNSCTMFIWYNL